MRIVRTDLSLDDMLEIHKIVEQNHAKGLKTLIDASPYEDLLSENQRRYYFGVVVATCMKDEQWGGYTKEQVHEQLKIDYLPEYDLFLKELGEEQDITEMMRTFLGIYHDLTITTKTKGEFEAFMSRIRAGEGKKGIYIPLPNESHWWEGAELIR